jgi:ferric-dicitrate binding protein FerR (iron transport regulator)
MTKDLFIKYLQGNCTDAEFQKILTWIKDGAATTSDAGMIQELWNEFEPEAGSAERKKYNRILDKIHHQINISQNTRPDAGKKTQGQNRMLLFITRAAAILLLPVLTLLIYTTRSYKDQFAQNTNEIVVEAPAGSRMNFELGDGTKVWLNHGSKLKYPFRFNGESRKVFLTGEAYFVVAQNKELPFVVGTHGLDVKATGTAFNVSAYPEDDLVETTLVEGKVILFNNNNQEVKSLSPGECLKYNYNENAFIVESENTNRYTAWKDGRLVFRNDSLEQITKKLARWFNVEVVITDKKVKEFTYTATFTDETLAKVLELMTIPTPVSYRLSEIKRLPDGSYTRQKVLIGLKRNN